MPATTVHRLFSRDTTVTVEITAPAERIWALLTDAPRIPKWTATVLSVDGTIAPGARIALVSALDTKRTFKLRVKAFTPPTHLAWGDAMGTRTFDIVPRGAGRVTVTMAEHIGGPLFPLFARMIPPFDAAFDQFAADLKRAAEAQDAAP